MTPWLDLGRHHHRLPDAPLKQERDAGQAGSSLSRVSAGWFSDCVSESGDSEPFHQSQNSSSSPIPLGLEYPEPNPAYSARSYCPEATRPGPGSSKRDSTDRRGWVQKAAWTQGTTGYPPSNLPPGHSRCHLPEGLDKGCDRDSPALRLR